MDMCFKIWNKANIVTFIGLISSIIGMQLCLIGKQNIAIICLIFSGICDGFDGIIAKKIRKSVDSEGIGVELDSLVDIVSSGIFPIIIMYSLGFNKLINIIIYAFFAICGVTRLTYFNVTHNLDEKYFYGIPITVSTIIIPIVYALTKNEMAFMLTLFLLSVLYVCNIKIKKPSLRSKIEMSICGLILIGFIIIRGL